jgi:hypothetical protein
MNMVFLITQQHSFVFFSGVVTFYDNVLLSNINKTALLSTNFDHVYIVVLTFV